MSSASLYRREGTKNWCVRYRDHAGKLRRKSTGTPDKAEAQIFADQIGQKLDWEHVMGAAPPAGEDGLPLQSNSLPWDAFDQHVDRLEAFIMDMAREHAESQLKVASQASALLRSLALRIRHLERRVARLSTGD